MELYLSLGYAVSPATFRPFLGFILSSGAGPAVTPHGLSIQVHVLTSLYFSEQSLEGEDVAGFRSASGSATLRHLSRSGPIPEAGERNA